MPLKEQASKERHEKIALMGDQGQRKRNSLQHQVAQAPKEKVTPFRGSIDAKFEDKITSVKNGKICGQPDRRTAERGTTLKSTKPWPGRKANTVDELVKHMSNVPSYLQRTERADHLQDKALNVGVLEWGRLARWTHHQKHATNRSHGASPSSTNEFLLFSAPSSPAHTSASPSSKALQSKQSPPVNGRQHSSVKSQQTCLVDKHPHTTYSYGSKSPVLSLFPGHGKYLYSENGGDYGGLRPSNVSLTSDSILAASQIDEAHDVIEAKESSTKKEERAHHCSHSLFADEGKKESNCFELSENNESMCNHLQQSIDAIGINFDSPVSNAGTATERNGNRSPSGFLEDNGPSFKYPYVPYSCPLPHTDLSEELDTGSTPLREDFVGTIAAIGENILRNQSIVSALKKPAQHDAKFNNTVEKTLPNHHPVSGLNRMSRSSSLKEASSAGQPKLITSVDKINGDKPTTSNKGRRSPLRRMLDPLLKPRRTSSAGPITPSFIPKSHGSSNTDKQPLNLEESASHNVQRRSVGARMDSTYQTKGNMTQPPRVLLNSERYLQQEQSSTSTRQALLQLAWKNGLPLFMLSSGDSDILAATVRRKGISDKDDLESMYAIFTVEEPKRKGGAWIKTGNKNKKHQLVSNVVGEMGVSLRKSRCGSSKKYHVHREFVLVGSELLSSSDGSGDSQVNRELAAVISKVPHQAPETSHRSSSQNSGHSSSAPIACACPPLQNLQPELSNVSSGAPSVIAILSSGFHGSSTSGEPSPLIERWKSGGACDCGGWDEGCMLTVLTDDSQQCNSDSSIQSSQTMDGTQRFDLLAQGRSREDGHAFSMVSFREGLYTVEFSSSIALLQAFVMCIAILHGRSPSKLQVGTQALQEHAFLVNHELKAVTATQGRSRTSYVLYHPPLSPVGRA